VIQNNNMERAVDWIFSHADEVAAMDTDQASSNTSKYNDGTGSKLCIIKAPNHMHETVRVRTSGIC